MPDSRADIWKTTTIEPVNRMADCRGPMFQMEKSDQLADSFINYAALSTRLALKYREALVRLGQTWTPDLDLDAAQHFIDQIFLFMLELVHFFLYRSLRDQADDLDCFFLPDAMGAVGSLLLDCWVPPQIIQDYRIRSGQFNPVPPAFMEMRKISLSPSLNRSHSSTRSRIGVDPSK